MLNRCLECFRLSRFRLKLYTVHEMVQLHGVGITGEVEIFGKPIFQTFGMFVGMLFGLEMHWTVVFFKIPFPSYAAKATVITI